MVADAGRGLFVDDASIDTFHHRGDQFAISGEFNVPRSPQGYPVQIQAGDSDGGRIVHVGSPRAATFDITLARGRRRLRLKCHVDDGNGKVGSFAARQLSR